MTDLELFKKFLEQAKVPFEFGTTAAFAIRIVVQNWPDDSAGYFGFESVWIFDSTNGRLSSIGHFE